MIMEYPRVLLTMEDLPGSFYGYAFMKSRIISESLRVHLMLEFSHAIPEVLFFIIIINWYCIYICDNQGQNSFCVML